MTLTPQSTEQVEWQPVRTHSVYHPTKHPRVVEFLDTWRSQDRRYRQGTDAMNRREILAGYATIAVIAVGLGLLVNDYGRRNEQEVLGHYLASQHASSLAVGDKVGGAIRSIYENLRTLSLLPSTRTIARHGENLSDEARLTFQQVYNNLAGSVSVSEVYILPADLDPERIDPVTGKLEAPILMFDELIVDARNRYEQETPGANLPKVTDANYQAEVEIYEYREMREQLAFLKKEAPVLSAIGGLAVPMVSSPELITCDNTVFIHTLTDADRSGIVFTVPFYGPDEKLRGAVSAIMLSSALEALLPRDYALVNVGNDYVTGLRAPGQQVDSAIHVRAGRPDKTLLYSEVVPVKTSSADSPFALWVGHPDADFYGSRDFQDVRWTTTLAYTLIAILGGAAALVWFLVTRNFQVAQATSASLEQRVAERTAEIRFLATHDVLTGLANRASLSERLNDALKIVGANGRLALLGLDLDNFKAINDTLGHQAGDEVLRAFAERLTRSLGEHDLAARFGGDEFVILLPGAEPNQAEAVSRRLLEVVADPFELDGQPYHIGLSIGIAICPTDGEDSETLFRNADIALYRAKSDGRGTFRFFEAAMDASLRQRQMLEKELRRAVEREEFELHYQPLVEASSEEVTGFEALVRWRHPDRGLLPPSEFISLAEDIGLINALGEWVLRRACIDAVGWVGSLKVAVNLSPEQFKQQTLAHAVVSALNESGLAPHRLELEITESALLERSTETLALLHQFRALGVRIAMDDFGTGFSSLSYLRSFPFDRIKIDRSFVSEITESKDCRSIVSAVAALGNSLGMTTTAEGIETYEQLQLVKAQGCTDLQGYYFSKPLPPAEVSRFLEEHGPERALREAASA
jgi:diguanylate cyclase (GGDEF)-like protein